MRVCEQRQLLVQVGRRFVERAAVGRTGALVGLHAAVCREAPHAEGGRRLAVDVVEQCIVDEHARLRPRALSVEPAEHLGDLIELERGRRPGHRGRGRLEPRDGLLALLGGREGRRGGAEGEQVAQHGGAATLRRQQRAHRVRGRGRAGRRRGEQRADEQREGVGVVVVQQHEVGVVAHLQPVLLPPLQHRGGELVGARLPDGHRELQLLGRLARLGAEQEQPAEARVALAARLRVAELLRKLARAAQRGERRAQLALGAVDGGQVHAAAPLHEGVLELAREIDRALQLLLRLRELAQLLEREPQVAVHTHAPLGVLRLLGRAEGRRVELDAPLRVAELHPDVAQLAHDLGTQLQVGRHLLLRVGQRTLEARDRLVGLSDCGVERGEGGEGRHDGLRLAELLVQLAEEHHALDGALGVAELGVGPAERLEQLDLRGEVLRLARQVEGAHVAACGLEELAHHHEGGAHVVERGGLLARVAGVVGCLGEVVPPGGWEGLGGVGCCVEWERGAAHGNGRQECENCVELREAWLGWPLTFLPPHRTRHWQRGRLRRHEAHR